MSIPPTEYQPSLFGFSDSAVGVAELFPAVWRALEQLTSPTLSEREAGLSRIVELDAHRLSSLVAYVLATRIDDQSIEFRFEVVQVLGELLSPVTEDAVPTAEVKATLKAYLAQMRQRKIFALLQVGDHHLSAGTSVAVLLKACSNAGRVLADIFLNRSLPLEIRLQAVQFAGIVGFLDTIPSLEKLAARLEGRLNGQRSMTFMQVNDSKEKSLLPAVQTALAILKAP
jgi:hypothetical protein